ncbi:MAG: DUF6152 family protein [Arenicellaceae bacterium]|nr:DUF6152 family protein [Arenicellaceae bacterium]
MSKLKTSAQSISAFLLILLLIGIPGVPQAHHSPTMYQRTTTELEGELFEVKWRNPHITFRMLLVDATGEEFIWDLEGHSIFNLQRAGITRESLPVGERVRVIGRKSNINDHSMLADKMILQDGSELELWSGAFSQFNDAENLQDAESDNLGVFRVWTLAQDDVLRAVTQTNDLPLTEGAISIKASWNGLDNYSMRCEAPGMPAMMLTQNPMEFVNDGQTIRLRTDYYDLVRTIHMEQSEVPPDIPYSHLGYSIGHWEGDNVLVIKTTQINWPYLDNRGTPLSDTIEVVERLSLSEDQSRLDFQITLTDPSMFYEPAVLRGQWFALGDTIGRYQLDCPDYDD